MQATANVVRPGRPELGRERPEVQWLESRRLLYKHSPHQALDMFLMIFEFS